MKNSRVQSSPSFVPNCVLDTERYALTQELLLPAGLYPYIFAMLSARVTELVVAPVTSV